MNPIDCLDSKQLIKYTDGKLTENENKKIRSHLSECERCARNLDILKQLDEILYMESKKFESDIHNLEKKSNCITDELLYKYLEGKVTESEAEVIEKHLNSCNVCFNEMASVAANSLFPATVFEKKAIAKMRTLTPDEQVSKILEYCEQYVKKPEKRKEVQIATTIKNRIKEFFKRWIYTKYLWRPAVAFSILIFFIAGIYWIIRYYNTGYQILQAENLLLENHRIYIGDARLSGGFGSTSISDLMAPDEDKFSYVEKAKLKVNKAIKKGSKSIKAKQLLAQIFIIENQNAKADSIFLRIEKEIVKSASLLNDIGVLYFQKQEWRNAAGYFQSAIEIDDNFREAYYNLALAKRNLNEFNEALFILNKYLKIEKNENWKRCALQFIDEINNTLEELK